MTKLAREMSPDDLELIETAGREACKNGSSAVSCPFSFDHSGCLATRDYTRFNREYRQKMDAWMRGWIAERKTQP